MDSFLRMALGCVDVQSLVNERQSLAYEMCVHKADPGY